MESRGKNGTAMELRNLSYSNTKKQVLCNLNLSLRNGEIHSVIGEMGAGKSTLGLVLAGILQGFSGELVIDGLVYSAFDQSKARFHRIALVSQMNPQVSAFTIVETMLLDHRMSFFPLKSLRKERLEIQTFLNSLEEHFELDMHIPVSRLSLSDQLLIEILKQLFHNPRILILDETLGRLDGPTLSKVRSLLKHRVAKGMAILHISHQIDELFFFADRVSVMKEGKILFTDRTDMADRFGLIQLAYSQFSSPLQSVQGQPFYHVLKYNEAILNDLPLNLLTFDRHGSLVLINHMARIVFGLKEGVPGSLQISSLLDASDRDAVSRTEHAIQNGESIELYRVNLSIGERAFLANLRVIPIMDGPHATGSLVLIEDITLQEEIRVKAQISANLASLGLLAAGVAHEINNPLEIIQYYLENIRFNTDNPAVIKTMKNIADEIDSITQIVSSLMDMAKAKSNKNEEFDLRHILRDLLGLIQFYAEKNGYLIESIFPEDPVTVNANRQEIKQVLLNLIKNGFEAMPAGGKLLVILDAANVSSTGCCNVTIADEGPGIPGDLLSRLFQPFFSSKGDQENHLGLGLSLCLSIVERNGGSLYAANREQGGAVFTVTLPRVESTENRSQGALYPTEIHP